MNSVGRSLWQCFLLAAALFYRVRGDEFEEQKIISPVSSNVFGRPLAAIGNRVVTAHFDIFSSVSTGQIVTLERRKPGWEIAGMFSPGESKGLGSPEIVDDEIYFRDAEQIVPFRRVDGTWQRMPVIGFGHPPGYFSLHSFKVSRERIVASGAYYRELPTIHVFARAGSGWIKEREIGPSDPSSHFQNLALEGDRLMAIEQYVDGATMKSRVQIYDLANEDVRTSLDPPATPGPAGPAVALGFAGRFAGELALVAYPQAQFTNGQGAIYSYRFDFSEKAWRIVQEIRPEMPQLDGFASAMAVSGRKLLVGAPYRHESHSRCGAVFLFELADTAPGEKPRWYERKKFVASDAGTGDEFGREVAIAGDGYVMSAPNKDGGIVYIFEEMVRLQTQRTSKGFRLFWPSRYQRSSLEWRGSLTNEWEAINPSRWSETGHWVVDVAPEGTAGFYRVQREPVSE